MISNCSPEIEHITHITVVKLWKRIHQKSVYLFGGLEHFLFFHILGNNKVPTDFHIFQRGRNIPPTRYICV